MKIEPNITQIQEKLPTYDRETIVKLAVLDRGSPGANMTTFDLEIAVKNSEAYELTPSGIKPSRAWFPIDLEKRASAPCQIGTPPFLEIDANWDNKPYASGDANNILGDNGLLTLPKNLIDVPVVDAEEATLAYYGATLIKPGEAIRFPDAEFPLWKMEVGSRYVPDFLMTNEGGGYYLEYHSDQPHFHFPLKGGGYYLLAKWNEKKTKLQITGFRIPDGHAVYTKKGAIHCDAALTGDLIVGYTTSEHCSTVLLRDPKGVFVNMRFLEEFSLRRKKQ